MAVLKSIQKFEHGFDAKAEKVIWHHPILGALSLFVGMPLFVLTCVCIGTFAIALPLVWLFGLL